MNEKGAGSPLQIWQGVKRVPLLMLSYSLPNSLRSANLALLLISDFSRQMGGESIYRMVSPRQRLIEEIDERQTGRQPETPDLTVIC